MTHYVKPYFITPISTQNILELNKLSLRSLKYIEYINLSYASKSILKRIKQLKILRKVSIDRWVSHREVESALSTHHKDLKQVYMSWPKDLKKISKNQLGTDYFVLNAYDRSVYRSFLTKIRVKNLCLDFSSGEIWQLENFLTRNIFSVVRQMRRLNDLSNIDVKASSLSTETSYKLLSVLDKGLLRMPSNITVKLNLSSPNSFITSSEQSQAFNSIPQRTVSIKTDDGDFFAKQFSSQVSSFLKLRTHSVSVSPAKERDLQDIQKFKSLENLHSLYFRIFSNPASDEKLTKYLFQNFTFPSTLKHLNFKYGSLQYLHEVSINSEILLPFTEKIKILRNLEELRLSFYPESLEGSEGLYPILMSTLEDKPSLRSLHLSICNKFESENESYHTKPFNISELFSQFYSTISNLYKIHLEFSRLSFQDFNQNTAITANDILLHGKFSHFEGLQTFLQCLSPQDPDNAILTLNIYEVEEKEIRSIFNALSGLVNMNKISIQIYPISTGSSKIFGYLRTILTTLNGPKELTIRILGLNMGKEAALVVRKSLENSGKTMKKVKIQFKAKGDREWSFYIFEKVGDKYQVTSEYLAFNMRRIFLE